jgi:O-methyltransferase
MAAPDVTYGRTIVTNIGACYYSLVMINSVLKPFGIKVARAKQFDPLIDTCDEFLEVYEKIAPYTMTTRARCYALYTSVKYILAANIPGDFVECGVWRGGNTMLIAYLLKKYGASDKRIYLYDTFEGMSEPSEHDKDASRAGDVRSNWLRQQQDGYNEWCYAGLDEVTENMKRTGYPEANVVFVKGKVEDTLLETVPKHIALLRLDTDWYESTKAELEILYPLLQDKGVLIIDDYGTWEGARKAVDEYFAGAPILLNKIDGTGHIAVKA